MSPLIDNYMIKYIYPYCSNTHSNSYGGMLMKKMIIEVKQEIRESFGISDNYKILFTGNGTTGALNHLINIIDYLQYNKVIIYVTLYEHYSNYLPWVELSKYNKNIEVIIIPFIKTKTHTGIIDLNWLNKSINETYHETIKSKCLSKTLIICSITACSNITGIITPTNKINKILNLYPNTNKFHKYFFF